MLDVGRRAVPTDLYQLARKVPNFQEPTSGFRFNPAGFWKKKGRLKLLVLLLVKMNS